MPMFDAIYTSLNVDISGTRYDIKKWSTAFFPVFLISLHEKIKSFISYSLNNKLN